MKNITPSVFTFENLIKNNYLYVDKTEYIWNLVKIPSSMYFFSRPRRFGKSLTISTLKAVFQGKRELFKETAIYNKDYDWQTFPIIHLDMGSCAAKNKNELENFLLSQISIIANDNNIGLENTNSCSIAFSNLILALSKNNQKVVILLDEYDKPILNNILEPQAKEILEVLKGFYSVIKTCEPHERFVFITGVTKFSHISIFSNLNNLQDITMNKKYALMAGYTQKELEFNFAPYITEIAKNKGLSENKLLEKMKYWYNGYKFEEDSQTAYNPSSIAQFFLQDGKFTNYWFSTGTTTFLLTAMKNQNFDLENALTEPVSQLAFSAYEIEKIEPILLLLQTGYLTIKDSFIKFDQMRYMLGFPNFEVQSSFETYLLRTL